MNIALIGMPGAGKTFVGKRLATHLGYTFIDPDKILETEYEKPLQDMLNELGETEFLAREWKTTTVATRGRNRCVISTGGSIVYSEEAMDYLADISFIIYLSVAVETLHARIGDAPRGVVGAGTKSLEELFRERDPLYRKWANAVVNADREPDAVLTDILARIEESSGAH